MADVDIGVYCRQVEDYLTRGNGGHLVRIVGPGFELVRGWANEGIPLSVVQRGIDLKLDRHRTGQSSRPLRIEFCEGDVRQVYEHWRRAVGLHGALGTTEAADAQAVEETKRPSLSRHFDRAIERLGRASGRLDVPDAVRDAVGLVLTALTELRDHAKNARGEARDAIVADLRSLDVRLGASVRAAAAPDLLAAVQRDATQDLAPFRDRLPADRWQAALAATVDRLLRDRWGLPTLDL